MYADYHAPGFAPSVPLYFYTQHSVGILKPARKISKKVHDVSKGGRGSPEEHPYDVSRGQN